MEESFIMTTEIRKYCLLAVADRTTSADSGLKPIIDLINNVAIRPRVPVATRLLHHIWNVHLIGKRIRILKNRPYKPGTQVPRNVAVQGHTPGLSCAHCSTM
jgi:hypothetical protein